MLRRVVLKIMRAIERVQLFLMGHKFRRQVACYERYRKTAMLYSDRLYNIPEALLVLSNLDAVVQELDWVSAPWSQTPYKFHPTMDVFQLYAAVYKSRKLPLKLAMNVYSGGPVKQEENMVAYLKSGAMPKLDFSTEINGMPDLAGRFGGGRFG